MDVYLGQISIFPYTTNRIINGWLPCDGRLLQISQNEALFTLLGTTYGGDGVQTFGIPNTQGRVPVGQGTNLSGKTYTLGASAGSTSQTLTIAQLPPHNHAPNPPVTYGSVSVSNQPSTSSTPGTIGIFNDPNAGTNLFAYNDKAPNVTINVGTSVSPPKVGNTGIGQPTSIMNPSLAVKYWIAILGVYPTQS